MTVWSGERLAVDAVESHTGEARIILGKHVDPLETRIRLRAASSKYGNSQQDKNKKMIFREDFHLSNKVKAAYFMTNLINIFELQNEFFYGYKVVELSILSTIE